MARVAINGFGRIGRAFLKLALMRPELDVVAINDLGDVHNAAYLLRFDSAYGRYSQLVRVVEDAGRTWLEVGSGDSLKKILFIQENDATKLPWETLGVDIVVESTGVFESFEKAKVHLDAGAKRVVLTAPAKDDDTETAKTVLMGVNDAELSVCTMSSNGSCTTNSISPVMRVLADDLGIKKAFLNTVHGYTATQNLVDGPVKGTDYRRGRAAATNITPSSTGAAVAVARVLGDLSGKFDGMAMRVPVVTGSLSSVVFLAKRATSVEEINTILEHAAGEERWRGVLAVTRDQLVSSDIVGDPHAAIVDLSLTKVVDEDLCAVYSWYDNEFGYTNTLVAHVSAVAATL